RIEHEYRIEFHGIVIAINLSRLFLIHRSAKDLRIPQSQQQN
ncbi:3883_t:CDS:1, partial [Dentiscutata heterogama]